MDQQEEERFARFSETQSRVQRAQATGGQDWRTVVGVVGDVRQSTLIEGLPDFVPGAVYMPYPQAIRQDGQIPASMTLLARAGSDNGLANRAQHDVFVGFQMVFSEIEPNCEVGKRTSARDAHRLPAQIFEPFGIFAADQRVVGVVRHRADDVYVEAACFSADRCLRPANTGEFDVARDQRLYGGWAAAHEDGLDGEALFLEVAFGQRDAKGQLVIPREADEDHSQVF